MWRGLALRVVTADQCRCCLGMGEGRWPRVGEAMSQQPMRKGGAIGGVRHVQGREGADWVSRAVPSRSKIIMLSRSTPRGYWSLSACPQVPSGDCETPFFPNDSDVRAANPWPIFAVPGVIRSRPAEEPILGLGGRCVDHEQAN
jgi:hypothetical protein